MTTFRGNSVVVKVPAHAYARARTRTLAPPRPHLAHVRFIVKVPKLEKEASEAAISDLCREVRGPLACASGGTVSTALSAVRARERIVAIVSVVCDGSPLPACSARLRCSRG